MGEDYGLTDDLDFFDTGLFSDCKVIAENGKVFNVHRVILARADWFRAALKSPFEEGIERTIKLPESERIVKIMLHWIYDACDTAFGSEFLDASAQTLVQLSVAAKKYLLWDSIGRYLENELIGELLKMLRGTPRRLDEDDDTSSSSDDEGSLGIAARSTCKEFKLASSSSSGDTEFFDTIKMLCAESDAAEDRTVKKIALREGGIVGIFELGTTFSIGLWEQCPTYISALVKSSVVKPSRYHDSQARCLKCYRGLGVPKGSWHHKAKEPLMCDGCFEVQHWLEAAVQSHLIELFAQEEPDREKRKRYAKSLVDIVQEHVH